MKTYKFYKNQKLKVGNLLCIPFNDTVSLFLIKAVNKRRNYLRVVVIHDYKIQTPGLELEIGPVIFEGYWCFHQTKNSSKFLLRYYKNLQLKAR